MANILRQYGIKEVADVTFYELDNDQPGNPVLVLDSLKISSIEQTSESTDAKGGKGNAPLITWDYGKEIVLTIEDALFSIKSLCLANGKKLNYKVDENEKMRRVNVYGIPRDTKIWKKEGQAWVSLLEEKLLGKQISANGMMINGKYLQGAVKLRTMQGKEINPWDSITDEKLQSELLKDCFYEDEHTKIIYLKKGYYLFSIITNIAPSEQVLIKADDYPGTYYITGDTIIRDAATGRDKLYRFVIPKGKILLESNTIAMEAEGEPAVFSMSIKALKPETGPLMYCQDYVEFYGTTVEMRTFLEVPNPDLSEEEIEVTKEQILEIEEQNGNLVRKDGINYVTRSIPMNSMYSEVRLLPLEGEQQVSIVSSNETFIDTCELPSVTAGTKYSDPVVSTSKGFSYGAKKAYLDKDIIKTAAKISQKNTAVVEMQRLDGVVLSLVNVDSMSWSFHDNGMLKYFKIVLDESDGNVWIAAEISRKGEVSFTYWINYDWICTKEGMLWILKMAARLGVDLVTLFNPFGKAASLGTRVAMSLGNRFFLRAAVFQLDENMLHHSEYGELTIYVMNYATEQLTKLINKGGN